MIHLKTNDTKEIMDNYLNNQKTIKRKMMRILSYKNIIVKDNKENKNNIISSMKLDNNKKIINNNLDKIN